MLYKIGTLKELDAMSLSLPESVMTELTRDVAILDCEYGEDRNWQEAGGYSVVIETAKDLEEFIKIIDYDRRPCEWATRVGRNSGWLSALFLFGNEFAIMAFMPVEVAPNPILQDLEE
ncbi:MAG: hypothetical protein PUH00_04140 [Clostridiales bacterium]|uniref:hypothetical protein n=1 Tax=Evtepia sp. TaxID=2773933 RepID=UPI0029857282|nr:hypothetical protein [Evtepia sp.]MDD7288892.1 hypothetical protein [Clostridiales bacterium]MDY4429491.1 hypothetical protein [Evtepia sp.]